MALRISQMIPALDPNLPNSPANIIANTERTLVSGAASLLQQVEGFVKATNQLRIAINAANRSLYEIGTMVSDLVDSTSRTGVYVHMIGLDGTIHSTDELNSAAGRALLDTTDPNRPTASGENTFFAGCIVVFGSASPGGFAKKLDSIKSIFGGLKTDVKETGIEVKKIGSAFKKNG